MTKAVVLKPHKEIAVERRHPWIFSGAVATMPGGEEGAITPIHDHRGNALGWGYFNSRSNIIGRILSWNPSASPESIICESLEKAVVWRLPLLPPGTTAYRLVNAEGDNLPGLIIDRYDDVLVLQVHTLGIAHHQEEIVSWLVDKLKPRGIYEKSKGTARRQEGLPDVERVIYGEVPDEVVVTECGLRFAVTVREGQKTGLFLDQRAMRQRVRELAVGRRVLNCFAYAGGFSLYAYAGGAIAVDSVDISARAIGWAERNFILNGGAQERWHTYVADVFTFLTERDLLAYDLVILDPPAFAKRQRDAPAACRGYRELNRLAMAKLRPGALLLTCSCSQPVNEELFREQLFLAALETGRSVQVLERLRHSPDHPVSLFHSEGNYLKGLLLRVDG